MKKKWIGIMAALALFVTAPVQVQAEEFSGGDDWKVTFNGEKLDSTFKNADIDDAIYQLQPGDTVNIRLELKNTYDGDTRWYMTNQVLQSLEDSQSAASGGAYSYILTFTAPDGTIRTLYSSESVGGDTAGEGGEGLHQATNAMEDYFYLDELAKGEQAELALMVKLEGETQGNTYQDTLAKLQMNFAVELLTSGSTPLSNHTVIKTGDTNHVLLFSLLALAAGMFCIVLLSVKVKREKKEEIAEENRNIAEAGTLHQTKKEAAEK